MHENMPIDEELEGSLPTFHADKITLRGPQSDGTFNVVLSVGEYERHLLKPILDIPSDRVIEVKLTIMPEL